ncbi:allophanate hydrolase [Saccharobesus litoralis]|uniref:Allophanate hydrolase n=1 Tax=Saccharobesus litoralis TaxID=2172099 RepID=A0A2S0VPU0_9ALTE|nr:biotin-dependent carboxyltransferase family protein [Saccharobesus litoralis]AWB66224.1 allophanate hydrolase [Saccharobesus litoralis]
MQNHTTAAFNVLNAGALSLLQDLGRYGHANLGLTSGGAADKQAFAWANRLVNNPDNACCIEITLGGLELACLNDSCIAITGAEQNVSLNQQPIKTWQSYRIKRGDILKFGFAQHGCRAYLAIHGGFAAPLVLGSRSTVCREAIGGLTQGQSLQTSQTLAVNRPSASVMPLQAVPQEAIPSYKRHLVIRLVLGYQYQAFSQAAIKQFFAQTYHVSQQADRMGYRLTGEPIKHDIENLYSEGISFGAVQIPLDGQPIVLGPDRQTIGGYPKIGSVLSIDMDKIMQATTGCTIQFCSVSLDNAQHLIQLAQQRFKQTQLIQL